MKVFNLTEKYKSDSSIIRGIEKMKLTSNHSKFKIGDVIQFYGGYNNNILFQSKITGFDKNGGIYVLWDCYWFPINMADVKRKIKLVG